jgi:predicted transposase YbfD/YdcC
MAARLLSMVSHFEELADPRVQRTRLHSLVDIICLSICAVIAGAEGWEDIEEFGRQKESWLRRHLRLENGIPSHDTISRVFRLLKPQAFDAAFRAWVQVLAERLGLSQIAIDGKTLRRSHDRGSMKSTLHLVCAWSVENHLVLGQQAVDDKSNEITAIPELLRLLELKGAIITIDAMGCQTEIADQIAAAGGDYVLAVKDNQPTLHAALQQRFEQHHESGRNGRGQHARTNEKGHGRRDERHYYHLPIPEELSWIKDAWRGARSLGQAISYSTRDGQTTSEVRYYLSSLAPDAKRLAGAVRNHWGIENSLHWVLDMSFDEDQCRIRKDHGPVNFALLRRIAINLIKQDTSRGSIRKKRKRAAWNDDALLTILTAAG